MRPVSVSSENHQQTPSSMPQAPPHESVSVQCEQNARGKAARGKSPFPVPLSEPRLGMLASILLVARPKTGRIVRTFPTTVCGHGMGVRHDPTSLAAHHVGVGVLHSHRIGLAGVSC